MPCLYQVTNLVNGKYYIGVHQDTANVAYWGSGKGIRAAIKKYGRENFKRDILAECETEAFAYQLERAVVDEVFVGRPETYNIQVGGTGQAKGYVHPDVVRAKISAGGRGLKRTAATRQKMSATLLGNTRWLGKKHTAETRLKMSEFAMKRATPAYRQKMSVAAKHWRAAKREMACQS